MMKELDKTYDPKQVEDKIYQMWEKSGYFNPDNLPPRHKKPFTIIMPPPNANGSLHIGHALFVTLEDIMIRYQRMQGRKSLWLPGADHAGFETQVVYTKKLEKEGRSFWEMPREQLYEEIKKFTLDNKKYMEGQLRKLGASCDWSREKFTLDEDIKKVVYETFKKLHDDNLVYRAERPVNWCIKHQTTLSDLEIKHEERRGKLYYIKYLIEAPTQGWSDSEYVVVATTRPETIPADIALAVHPKSKWAKYVGKNVLNPLNSKLMPVVADAKVDPEFGTGALKITPFHDPLDFEIFNAHKNEISGEPISVINQYGKLTENAGKDLAGLKVKEAREKSAELLQEKFSKEPGDYKHQVAVCYKCSTTIEPRVMMQWFVKMTEKPRTGKKSLRDLAVEAAKSKKIKFIPARQKKIFMHWMKNLRDWNISRQIVWGIQIPAWYHEPKCIPRAGHEGDIIKCKEIIISVTEPKCEFCDAKFVQETDVFDTWFSSGQWPFATLMTTKKGDFKKYYPTDVMETGWDILFFWVTRMMMLGIYRTSKIPFKNVYLHGLVRDKDRQKMSKSKGNVINPLEVADVYGTDAVRMALVIGTTAGNDPIISEDKIRGYRNFATKIWNASRFVLMNYRDTKAKPEFTASDRKNLKDLATAKKKITAYMDKSDFNHAAETAYHYFWHTIADKVIEQSKPRLKSENLTDAATAQIVLLKILLESLKLLHPFMPFITEEVYQMLPNKKQKVLMIEEW
ncbi:MAG: valine--tRNA ligase [Candidatus Harrisonbacteria bacterium]|nr:valine--tRNA ligase [Candidatus Harrisonbacteria bacterium]